MYMRGICIFFTIHNEIKITQSNLRTEELVRLLSNSYH